MPFRGHALRSLICYESRALPLRHQNMSTPYQLRLSPIARGRRVLWQALVARAKPRRRPSNSCVSERPSKLRRQRPFYFPQLEGATPRSPHLDLPRICQDCTGQRMPEHSWRRRHCRGQRGHYTRPRKSSVSSAENQIKWDFQRRSRGQIRRIAYLQAAARTRS